jgi:protein-S-isoprenylcysteine O-methyltransferase Ste14
MNSELTFRISMGILIATLATVRFRFIGWAVTGLPKAVRKIPSEQADKTWYRTLWFIGWLWVLAPILYALAPRWLAWSAIEMPIFPRWVGVGLGLSSIVFLAWVHRTLGKNWNVPGVIEAQQVLITDGPYRWFRHPMYTSFALIALAYWLISTNWFIAVIGLFYWIVVVSKVKKEEAVLIEKFGDAYREYMKYTGRFLPRVFSGG